MNFSVEKFHAEDVKSLAFAVLGAHEHNRLEPQSCTSHGCSYTVLPRTSFGDDTFFTHAFRQQSLPQSVIDFVGTAVRKVLAFEVDFCAAQFSGEVFGKVERGWSAHKLSEVIVKVFLEFGVTSSLFICFFKFSYGFHEDLWDKTSAIFSVFPINRVVAQVHASTNSLTFNSISFVNM